MAYDSLNRVVKSTNALGYSRQFAYDAVGNITHATNENGHTTRYKYSPLGDLIEMIDPTGHSTKYNYDNMSRLTKLEQSRLIQDPSTGLSHYEPQITTYKRNKKGEVVAVTSPLGDIVKYAYDKLGRMTGQVDEDGLETLYDYNLAGSLTKVSYADGKTVAFGYDALRRLTEMRDWLGTTTLALDPAGRITKTTDHEGNEVSYTWNNLGQREKLTYPNGKEVSYEYDPSGKLTAVTEGAGTTRYTYDTAGRLKERILPSGATTLQAFNSLGLITDLTHYAPAAAGMGGEAARACNFPHQGNNILDSFAYTYDPAGNITQIQKHRQGVAADTGVINYAYDPLGRLVEAENGQNRNTYAYDALGNRISSLQNGIETNYSYNARNQLIQSVAGATTTDYLYDKRGNNTQTIQNGAAIAGNSFDATNMMVSAFTHGKGSAAYTYNGFNSRVKKLENLHTEMVPQPQDPCSEVRYVLDMTRQYDNLLMTQGSHTQSYTWGNGLLAGSAADGTPFYYLQDHLGSPIRLLGGDNGSETLAYDEFGVPMVQPGQAGQGGANNFNNPFGFTRYQTDSVSGLQYAQARYYSPKQGRFTAEDPIKDQLNWYDYCGANPVRFTDPSGLYYIHRTVYKLCCTACFPDPYNPGPLYSFYFPAGHQCRGDLRGGTPSNAVITTTSIGFSHTFIDDITALGSSFGPLGTSVVLWFEDQLSVVGGPSSLQSSSDKVSEEILSEVLSILGKAQNIPGVEWLKPVKIIQGVINFGQASSYGQMDRIVQGFFQRNSIPTSHTVVTHNGQYDTTAEALLTAQMSAAYSFLQSNGWYFFNEIWAGNTLHSLDQDLMSPSRRGPFRDHSVNGFVDSYSQALRAAIARNPLGFQGFENLDLMNTISGFRNMLDSFELRSNFVNTMFMATIANATCSVMSNIPAIPPVIAQSSNQLSHQTQESLVQLHASTRQARDTAWRLYQNTTAPSMREINRERYEVVRQKYEATSSLLGVRPTNPAVVNRPAPQPRTQPAAPTQPPSGDSRNPDSNPGFDQPINPEFL